MALSDTVLFFKTLALINTAITFDDFISIFVQRDFLRFGIKIVYLVYFTVHIPNCICQKRMCVGVILIRITVFVGKREKAIGREKKMWS